MGHGFFVSQGTKSGHPAKVLNDLDWPLAEWRVWVENQAKQTKPCGDRSLDF
jgi:hypothetical protein